MGEFECAECGKELAEDTAILVDGEDWLPLDFCSWECLMVYAIKKHNKAQDTGGEDEK